MEKANIREFRAETDREAVHRIWREVGWMDHDERRNEGLDHFLACSAALVGVVRGEAECLATTSGGSLRYLDATVPASFVTAVTTGWVGWRLGLAGRMTACAVARDAREGALVSALGMFEQGFYDRLGYGTGGVDHSVSFDPSTIDLDGSAPVPVRLDDGDLESMHASRLARMPRHGACRIDSPLFTRAETLIHRRGFGLGFVDAASGELTHHLWMRDGGGEWGTRRGAAWAANTW